MPSQNKAHGARGVDRKNKSEWLKKRSCQKNIKIKKYSKVEMKVNN